MLSAILLSAGSVFLLGRAVFGKKKRGKSTTMEKREQLGSRLGFIMISAGCAIGCGNVWKFPWMCGQNGGGGFMLIYLICLLILGLPVMTMEFSVGRAARTSPLYMYQKLEKPGHKWGIFGIVSLIGNITLMAFYTVVCGWLIYYFVKFITGQNHSFGFTQMIQNPSVNVSYLLVTVIVAFLILSFDLQGGLERITKSMMTSLLILMLVLAVHSLTLSGAADGLKFYLVPDFSKINGSVIVGAMNQAFFTLSLGIGAMAILGRIIGKERSLLGESANFSILDTFVAITSGLIIFPACFTFHVDQTSGPSLIFITLPNIFNHIPLGRLWGSLFFIFMSFAAFSTILAVFENIISCGMELTGWSRKKSSLVNAIAIILLSLPCVLGYNVWSWDWLKVFGGAILDLEDFLVSNLFLPLGSLVYLLFCTSRYGWGWKNFKAEANTGKGFKMQEWMRVYLSYILPLMILFIFGYGIYDKFFA